VLALEPRQYDLADVQTPATDESRSVQILLINARR